MFQWRRRRPKRNPGHDLEEAARTLEEFSHAAGDIKATAAGTAQGNDGLSRDAVVTGVSLLFEDPLREDILDR